MANYTQDEIQAVVEQLVRSSIRRPYDTLGVRRNDITFNDIQEATAGVLLLFPKSPFYLAFLSGGRLKEVLAEEQAARQNILDALAVLRRRSLPVRDVSSLANAKAALFELEGAVTSTNPPKDVTKIPAYVRFNSNITRFLDAVGNNVKKDGKIVQTPEQSRGALPGLIEVWKTKLTDALERANYLANALNNYNSMGLPQILAGGVVQRSRALLDARVTSLESMTEAQRNEVLRQTVLEVLGVKAVVTKFGAFPGLSASTSISGTLSPFADATRPANPASALVPINGLFALVPGDDPVTSTNILDVWLNGAPTSGTPSLELFLPTSQYPKIDGNNIGPFTFSAGYNDTIKFLVDGTTTITVNFPAGIQPYSTVVSTLQAALAPQGFTAEGYFFPLMYDGPVNISGNNVSPIYGAFPTGSVNVGDEVDFYYGVNAIQTRVVTSVNTSGGAVVSIDVNGAPLTASTTDRIRYGSPSRKLRVLPIDKRAATANKRTIQVKQPTAVERQCGMTLGFYGELIGKGRGWDVQPISDFIRKNNSVCTSSTEVDVFLSDVTITTDPSDGFGLLLPDTTGVQPGMVVVIPSGINAGKSVIESVDSSTKVKIRQLLPQYKTEYSVGLTIPGCTVGFDQYRITSNSTLLTSKVEAHAPIQNGFYTNVVATASSTYLTFPGASKQLVVGDFVELYEVDTLSPSRVLNVLNVYGDDVFRVDGAVSTSFDLTSGTVPYARILKGHIADFDTLSQSLLDQTSKSDANLSRYFSDLNRYINPLLVNTNPTDSNIASAENRVDDMGNIMSAIGSAVDAYDPEVVPEMDQLVRGLKEKGADRAVDILLQGRFTDFFGLEIAQTSYAGALQEAVRMVSMNDLVIHKMNRLAQSNSPLRSSADSPDYETDFSDADPTPEVDPPVDLDLTTT